MELLSLEQVNSEAQIHLEALRDLIENNVKSTGLVESDCQQLTMLNALSSLERTFNGLEAQDMKVMDNQKKTISLDGVDLDDTWEVEDPSTALHEAYVCKCCLSEYNLSDHYHAESSLAGVVCGVSACISSLPQEAEDVIIIRFTPDP